MQTFSTIGELQHALRTRIASSQTLAFVPTMGNLHDGHLALVARAKQEADFVIVSIFVNPLQFGANEDLDKYPRTPEADRQKLDAAEVDFLFTPQVSEIYPEGMEGHTKVCVPHITENHCGASRPGHFDGVSTIVAKLFNIVQPDIAIFGQKDFQQLAVIRKMVTDLCMPIAIIGASTSRANDGLALSSRNQYLTADQRALAPLLYHTLQESQQSLLAQKASLDVIRQDAIKTLAGSGFKVDYFNICDAATLQNAHSGTQNIVILAAAFLGKTRLIDNISFSIDQ